ncbi:MAG: HAD family hydrolase [Bdellovibrionales bacterium]|nr:HAD family hydrolase [Bdellovibrionales bacterium]
MVAVHRDLSPQDIVQRIQELSPALLPHPTEVEPHLPRLDTVKAVLFDVYGTLFVSEAGEIGTTESDVHRTAFVEALQSAGFTFADRHIGNAISRYGELNRQQRQCLRDQGIDHPEMDIVALWRDLLVPLQEQGALFGKISDEAIQRVAIEYEYRLNKASLMPGFHETLDALRFAQIPFGLISNAQFYSLYLFDAFAGKSVRACGFEPGLTSWSFECGASKPSQIIFDPVLQGLSELNLEPHQALYVGNDMKNDVHGAAKQGMKTALFAGDARSLRLREDDPSLNGTQPDVVLTELAQLKVVLGLERI